MIHFPFTYWQSSANAVWVAQDATGRIATSGDNGATWTLRTSGLLGAIVAKPYRCPGTGTVLVPGTATAGYAYLSRSVDNGVSWTAIATTSSIAFSGVVSDGAGRWLVVGGFGTIWRSNDDGVTWTNISSNLTSTEPFKHFYGVTISPGGRTVISATFGLYYTDNFGDTWTQNTRWMSPSGLSEITVDYGRGTFVIGSEYVRTYTSANGTGTPSLTYDSGTFSSQVSSASFNYDASLYVAATSNSFGGGVRAVSTPDLATWTDISSRLPGSITGSAQAVAAGPDRAWIIGFTGGKMALSLDNTATFADISTNHPFGAQNIVGITSFVAA